MPYMHWMPPRINGALQARLDAGDVFRFGFGFGFGFDYGADYGPVNATVTGNTFCEGDSSYGRVIATVEGGEMSGAAAAAFRLMR